MSFMLQICVYFALIFSFQISTSFANEQDGQIIARLLSRLSQSAPQLSINKSKTNAANLSLSKDLNQFKFQSSFDLNRTQTQPAPTSPFVAQESEVNQLSVTGGKLWQNGLNTNITYSVQDSFTDFSGRTDFSFINPNLQLELSTGLYQDLIGKRYAHQVKNIQSQSEYNHLQDRIYRKGVLVQALLTFASILETQEEIILQKNLCQKTQIQYKKLTQKQRRGSVSKREFLQSLKEFNNCRATIANLEKLFIENKSEFEASYFIGLAPFMLINSSKLFKEIEQLYQQLAGAGADKDNSSQKANINLDVSQQDDVRLLALQLKALGEKQAQLNAQTRSNLNLKLKVGSTGAETSFADASSDMLSLEYPYIYAGVSVDLPLKNRNSEADAAANRYQIRAAQEQQQLTYRQKANRLQSLIQTLKKDFQIYERYQETVKISKQILTEANKDYTNGRIDYNSYTEFTKSLIQDQKVLSSHRIKVIIRAIEYLDFFQFFDAYVGSQEQGA